jgi:GDP-4-dehydro-6-deoxy-D-mannose reductase
MVTGARGFVGRHLLPRLVAEGWETVTSDRELDVADARAVARRVAKTRPEAIVHLAAQSSDALSWSEPELTYRSNFLGARSVLEAAAKHAPESRVLLIGSAAQYGTAEPGSPPWSEAAPLRPVSPYARSKAAADLLGATYARRGLAVVRVRSFNHSGPGQTDAFVLSALSRQLMEIADGTREPVLRVGNLESVRDFLDIEDVIEAYLHLLDPNIPPTAYNLARGSGIRIGDALESLLELACLRPAIEIDPERLRPTDVLVGDSGRLRSATGWEPRVPFTTTLERLLADWRGRLGAA